MNRLIQLSHEAVAIADELHWRSHAPVSNHSVIVFSKGDFVALFFDKLQKLCVDRGEFV